MKKTLFLLLAALTICACTTDNWLTDLDGGWGDDTEIGGGSGSGSGGGSSYGKVYDTGDQIHYALYLERGWSYKNNAYQLHISGGAFQVIEEEDYNIWREGGTFKVEDPYKEGGRKYAKCTYKGIENKYTKQGKLVYEEQKFTDEFVIDVTTLEKNGKLKLTRDNFSYSVNNKLDISKDPFAK